LDINGLAKIFLDVCKKFNELGVDYVVGGGFAVILHGLPRLTNDIDFFINPSPDNVNKIKQALADIFNDESIQEIGITDIEKYSVVRYGTPQGFYLDFIGKVGDFAKYPDLRKGVVYLEVETVQIPVCGIETLLWLKEHTLRPIDQEDVLFLKEKLRHQKEKQKKH
jgi:predicted nucleotidyltransferase